MRSKKPSKTWAWDDFNNTVSGNLKIPSDQKEWWDENVITLMDSRMTIKEINALSELIYQTSQYGRG